MSEEINEIILSVMADKIKSQEKYVMSLLNEIMILEKKGLPNIIRYLRNYGIVMVSFFDEFQTCKNVEEVLIRKNFNNDFVKRVSQEIFFLNGSSLSDTEKEAVLRAFNHGECRWMEKQKG